MVVQKEDPMKVLPSQEETLAEIQLNKVKRLRRLQNKLQQISPSWWSGRAETLVVFSLVLLNLLLLLPFWGKEDRLNHFSAPVIPVLADLTSFATPFTYSLRFWLLVFVLFFPVSFYFMVKEISGRKIIGFVASLVSSLPMFYFLYNRIILGILGEDGVHVASLTITPLACFFLIRFLRKGNFWNGVFSAVAVMMVALTSVLGLVVLFVFVSLTTFSEMLLGQGRLKLARLLAVLAMAMGFSAFWYNPKFILLTFYSQPGQQVIQALGNLVPVSFFLVPVLWVIGFLIFENRSYLQPLFLAIFLCITFGLFSLGTGVSGTAPFRFLPPLGISLAFLSGVVIVGIYDFLRASHFWGKYKKFLEKYKKYEFLKYFEKLSLHQKRLADIFLAMFFLLIFFFIFSFGSRLWSLENQNVLGISEEMKVGIWEIRSKTSLAESIFGYTITCLTVFSVIVLRLKLNKNNENKSH